MQVVDKQVINGGGYSRQESQLVAGIAIIMMFFFHFFAYPELQPGDNCYYAPIKYLGTPLEQIIAPLGQLCVAIFAFNSGFVIAKMNDKYTSVTNNMKRLLKFLIGYWIVCAAFLIVCSFTTDLAMPKASNLLQNLVGLKVSARADYINVAHAWYVSYYIILLVLAPVIIYSLKRTNYIVDIVLYILLAVLIGLSPVNVLPTDIKSLIWPLSISIAGYLVCKYNLLRKFRTYIDNHFSGITSATIGLLLLMFTLSSRHIFRSYNWWWQIDGIYAFLFVGGVLTLQKAIPAVVTWALVYIGSVGMFMWFTHSIFANGPEELNRLLYYPYIPTLILIWGLVLAIIPSAIFSRLHKYVIAKL